MHRSDRLKVAGIGGFLAPIIAFSLVLLAVASYPGFSWTDNALSDLGVVEGATMTLFNVDLIVGGAMTLVFASGLFIYLRARALGQIGAFLFIVGGLALTLIGVFPENVKPTHYYVSVTLFGLLPLSMLFMTAGFAQEGKMKLGLFTLLSAVLAAFVWAVQWTISFGSGVAIPEMLSALSASVWSIALGFKMLKEASQNQ